MTGADDAGGELVVVGRIGAPHGLRGALRLVPETDFPERLVAGRRVALVGEGGAAHWSVLRGVRQGGGRGWLITLEGVTTREAAQAFAGGTLRVAAADLPPLPPGRFYHHELVGLEVVAADGRRVGRVREVRATGANDVYVVERDGGGEAWVPAIRDAVAEIDVAAGRMVLRDLPGMLEP